MIKIWMPLSSLKSAAIFLSLANYDQLWASTWSESILGRVGHRLLEANHNYQFGQKFGTICQLLGFVVVLTLFFALGMPQFANDKEVLAIFVLLAMVLRLIGTLAGGREKYVASAIDFLVLLFLGINIVATFASHYLFPSLKGLAKLTVYVSSYFLFQWTLVQSRRRIFVTLGCLVASGFVVALYGLYQYKAGVAPLATWEDPTVEVKAIRIYSTLGNPNLLAGFLVPILPISISLAAIATYQRKIWLSVPLLGSALVIGLAIILTGSRGGYLGLVGALSCLAVVVGNWFWRKYKQSRIWLMLAIIAVIILCWLALHYTPGLEQRLYSIFAGGEHTSNRYRINVWQSSLKMLSDNWWFGVGPGNQTFRLAYGLYMITGFDALGTYCVLLEIAVEAGIFALILFCLLLICVLSRSHVAFYRSQDVIISWILVGCVSAILGLMAHGLVDTVFYRPQVQLIFWLVMATIVACSHHCMQKMIREILG